MEPSTGPRRLPKQGRSLGLGPAQWWSVVAVLCLIAVFVAIATIPTWYTEYRIATDGPMLQRCFGFVAADVRRPTGPVESVFAITSVDPDGALAKLAEARGIVNAFVIYAGGLVVLQAVGDSLGLTGRLRFGAPSDVLTAFDLFLFAMAAAVFGRSTVWVFAQGGAEVLARHREMFNQFPRSAAGVKVFWGAMAVAVLSVWLAALLGLIETR